MELAISYKRFSMLAQAKGRDGDPGVGWLGKARRSTAEIAEEGRQYSSREAPNLAFSAIAACSAVDLFALPCLAERPEPEAPRRSIVFRLLLGCGR